MIPIVIPNFTRKLGAPKSWNAEADGPCDALAVIDDGATYTSAWKPDAAEIAALTAGGAVILTVYGRGHPAIILTVDDDPKIKEAVKRAT